MTDVHARPPKSEASIGDLMAQLSEQTSRLVRDEIRLARKELEQSAKHGGVGIGLLGFAGVLAVIALAAFAYAGGAALALVLPVWAAALIVGGALLVVAGGAALISKQQADHVSAAPQTVANVRQDIHEVKEASHGR